MFKSIKLLAITFTCAVSAEATAEEIADGEFAKAKLEAAGFATPKGLKGIEMLGKLMGGFKNRNKKVS